MYEDRADEVIESMLDGLYPYISQDNDEQVALYSRITQSKSHKKQASLVRDLVGLIVCPTNKTFNKEKVLVDHISGLAAFLQTLANDPDLAGLFLVGEAGYEPFTSLQKSQILEQVARTRHFLQSFEEFDFSVDSDMINILSNTQPIVESFISLKETNNIEELRLGYRHMLSLLKVTLTIMNMLMKITTERQTESDSHQATKEFDVRWDLHTELSGLHRKNEELLEQLFKKKEEIENLRKGSEESEKAQWKLQEEVDFLQKKVTDIQERFLAQKQENEKLRSHIREMEDLQRRLSDEVDGSRSIIKDLRDRVYETTQVRQTKAKDSQLSDLKDSLKTLEEESRQERKQLKDLLLETQTSLKTENEENAHLKMSIKQKEENEYFLRQRVQQLEKELRFKTVDCPTCTKSSCKVCSSSTKLSDCIPQHLKVEAVQLSDEFDDLDEEIKRLELNVKHSKRLKRI